MPVVKNAVLHYVKVDKPVLKYEQTEVEGNPFANKEYVVDACILPNTFKAMKKKYASSVRAFKEVKMHSAEDYIKAFKVDPPEGYANADDEYFIMKFRCYAAYKDGEPTKKPSVVGVKGQKDKEGNVVGTKIGIGNGTEANIQFRERKFSHKGKAGIVLDLVALQVLHLIEYSEGLEFEMEEDDEDGFTDGDNFVSDDEELENAVAPVSPDEDDWEDD